jgi:hypothetical protein
MLLCRTSILFAMKNGLADSALKQGFNVTDRLNIFVLIDSMSTMAVHLCKFLGIVRSGRASFLERSWASKCAGEPDMSSCRLVEIFRMI